MGVAALGVARLRVVELRGLAEVEAIRSEWHALAQATPHDTPYVLPEFLLPWIRRLDGRDTCRFLAAWDGATLVGLAPVVERRIRRGGITLLALRGFPEAAPTPPCDLLVRAGASGVVEAFFAHWQQQRDWDAIELPTVPVESANVARLVELARAAGLCTACSPSLTTYAVPVEGSWHDYHAARSKKTRQNLRRGLRYFEPLGATRFATYPGELTFDEALAQVAHVVAHSWKEHEQGAGGWNAFLRDLMREFDRAGLLRLNFLMLDAHAVAYLMDVPFRNAWYAIHNAYDLRHQPGYAGQLMLARAIEDAHERRALRYDFTGNKDYLRRWTTTTRAFQHVRIDRGGALVRLKLKIYDRVHARRAAQVAAGTDHDKNARKDEFRSAEDRDG